MRTTITFLTLLAFCGSVKIPSNFQKCSRNNPNFKKCVYEAAKNVIPQLNRPYPELTIPNLEPFELTEATIGGRDGPVNIEQKFRQCRFYGFSKLQLDDLEINFEEKIVTLKGVFPEILMLCDYEMKGQVLLLSVNGAGNSTIVLRNVKAVDVLPFEEKKKKGKTYIKFTSSSLTIDPELVVFNFESTADKSFTDTINPVLNDNWKEIFEEVKGSYAQMFDTIILSVGNSFFNKVTKEEAFDDE